MMASTTPPTDTRRITEADPDFVRLKAKTERQLTTSIRQYVADLRRDGQNSADRAASQFIQRQLTIMRDAYLAAYAEGQRDYWQSVSNKPGAHKPAPMTPRQIATMRDRLMWYGAASVTKMAREAQSAYHAEQVATFPTVKTFADASGDGALTQWQDGVGVRVNLQADLTWGALQDGYVDAGGIDPGSPYAKVWWDVEPGAQHCFDCPMVAAGSPYDPPGSGGNELDQTPGDGRTECGAACKCDLTYGPPDLGSTVNWSDFFPPDMPQMQPTGATGAPSAGQGNAAPVPRPRSQQRDLSAADMLRPTPAQQDGELRVQQKAALDDFRSAWAAWETVRGAYASASAMFAPEDALAGLESQLPANWDVLTPRQQRALVALFEALAAWDAATQGGRDSQLREPVDAGVKVLFNPNHDNRGRFAPGDGGDFSHMGGADELQHMAESAVAHLDARNTRESAEQSKARIAGELATRLESNDAWRSYVGGRNAEEVASDLVHSWAIDSASPHASAIQLAARDEFGAGGTSSAESALNNGKPLYEEHPEAYRAFARAMYDNTQESLAKAGIHEVALYRGMGWKKGAEPHDVEWDGQTHSAVLNLRPLSSFSAMRGTASFFSAGEGSNRFRMMVAVRIPAAHIFSTAQSGFGCKSEGEMVVLGHAVTGNYRGIDTHYHTGLSPFVKGWEDDTAANN